MIGERVLRREDGRLLTGRARYLADTLPPGCTRAVVVRSPHAHARILGIDTGTAAAVPGVVAVLTGRQLAAVSHPFDHRLGALGARPLEWPVVACDKARFVGDAVAVVVAETEAIATDAAELVVVDYEPLAAVVDPARALEPDAPLLFEEWGTNEFALVEGTHGDPRGRIASATNVLRERFSSHRIAAVPLEGQAAWAAYDAVTDTMVLHASNQQPHQMRTVVAEVVGMPESAIRVVAPDMGGGFGNKQHWMREEALVAVLAKVVGRPVAWIQGRTEYLTSAIHSRPQVHDVEAAFDDDGRVTALRVKVVADVGCPYLYFSGIGPALVTIGNLTGAYAIEDYEYELHGVATTTCPIGAYRGFGQPQAHLTIERVMDMVAERCGLDPAEVRRRNAIPAGPEPYVNATGARIDAPNLTRVLDRLLEELDAAALRTRRDEVRGAGRLAGIGFSLLVEGTAPNQHGVAGRFGGYEMASLTVQPDGWVDVVVGTKSNGQGHETVYAQVASEELGVPVEKVRVHDGDTAALPGGMGTWGSRSAVMGGGAVIKAAAQVRDKLVGVAARLLEAPAGEVEVKDGGFVAEGRSCSFEAVAEAGWFHPFLLPDPTDVGLSALVGYEPGITTYFPGEDGRANFDTTYSCGASAALVEVDPLTGRVTPLDVVMVHDAGRLINPALVDGQILGGFAQGLGAALLEEIVYDADGNPLTTNLVDYTIPTAPDVPPVRIVHLETPSQVLGGFRGVGEAGIITAPALLANAVADALAPLGVAITDDRLSPAAMYERLAPHLPAFLAR